MVDQDLSRRKILAGMAVAGSSGALVGSGTVSLFSDEESFTNNNLTGSTLVAGAVEIDVTAQVIDERNGIEFEISHPESDTYENNPAYIWVRTLSCPVPTSAASRINVDVSLKEDGTTLDSGSVFDVFATADDDDDFDLNTGELLVPADANACLEPGGTRTLVVKVTGGPDDASAKIELEVYAEQCRYTSVEGPPEDPFDDADLIGKDCNCVSCESDDKLLEKWEFDDGECKFKLETDKGDDPYITEVDNYENKNSTNCDPKKVTFATTYCEGQTLWAEVKAGTTTIVQELEVTDGTVTVTNGDTGKGISNIRFYCEEPS